ncbi:MAG: Y-family DNA polymerase [Muribaculaceae bacterium]|nr:Y-family DNA polymerase [Muribaculaceae bacterium]MDE6522713.1 Y-family DNA polymerase [Muribaculaceae bacterium]
MVGLADCNNFFVSCERTLNPALENRAVVVLSNNDGCVVARSNEAKKAGIKMGQPAFQIKDRIQSGEIIALSGNHLLYRNISLKVHDIFRRYAPMTLDYSVDEAFLIMDGIPKSELMAIGKAIAANCWDELHIPVTIGFAPSKTLAKIVSEICKKRGRRVGVLDNAESARQVLQKMSISDLWGIGRRLSKRLYACGVYTIADFADKDLRWIRATLGVNGERSWRELHGENCIELSHVQTTLQDSVSESRTFPEDVDDYDYLRARIAIYAADCSKKLRAMGGACKIVGAMLQTNRFHQERGMARPEGFLKFDEPTDDTVVISNAAISILERIYIPNIAFKRAAVWLGEIVPKQSVLPSLFDSQESIREKTSRTLLMKAIDNINLSPGMPVLKLASQITQGHPGHNDGYSSSFQAPKS